MERKMKTPLNSVLWTFPGKESEGKPSLTMWQVVDKTSKKTKQNKTPHVLGWWVNEKFLYFLSNFAVNPKLFFIFIVFIWLHQVLVAACEILFPDQGLNLGLLHWELRVLATGPREKSPKLFFKIKSIRDFLCGPVAKIWPSYSGSVGSIPGQWPGIPHAWWPKNPTNTKQKQYCSKFSKDLKKNKVSSVPFKSRQTLCDPMNRSTPSLPVHHQLPESTQIHVHWVGEAIQTSHPLLFPSPSALNLSQYQGLFQWVSSLHQVAKVLEFQLQHQSFQWTPRTDLL